MTERVSFPSMKMNSLILPIVILLLNLDRFFESIYSDQEKYTHLTSRSATGFEPTVELFDFDSSYLT